MATAKKPAAAPEPEDNITRFVIEGQSYEISQDDLTWGEVEEMEVYFDQSISEIDLDSARGTMFLAYIARNRVEPGFTVSDMKRVKVADLKVDDAPRPTVSGDAASGTRS